MKIINKLEFTKEELETLEKAKKILEWLNSYPETQLSACFDNYCDIVEVVMETVIFFKLIKIIALVWRTDL